MTYFIRPEFVLVPDGWWYWVRVAWLTPLTVWVSIVYQLLSTSL